MTKPDRTDHKAILARVEQIVELLRTRHIRKGWKMDEDGAACTLAYFRRHVEGPPFENEDQDTTEFTKACDFVGSHAQSLDWILYGDPSSMICRLAKHSERAIDVAGPISRSRTASAPARLRSAPVKVRS
jgi:hypothetical protein